MSPWRAWAEKGWAPIAVLALAVGLFFGPALLQPDKVIWTSSSLGSDISYRHWPDLIGYAASLREGRIALWDPLTALGRPLAGDPGVLFGYPFTLLFLAFPPALAFTLFDAAHVFLAGLFAYLLLRVGYQTSRQAALIGGLAFAFMPKLIAHMAAGHVGVIAGLAWAPAVFLGLKMAFGGRLLAAALAGFALAMQMPTHVQEPYYTAMLGSILWLWQLAPAIWRAARGDVAARRRARWLLLVYAVWTTSFLLLAAVVIAPLVELLPYNSRADFTLADAGVYALPPTLLLTLLAPGHFQLSEWVVFLGVLPPLLGLVGFLKASSPDRWLWASLVVFALIYALGTATPLFGLAFNFIPGFRLLRVPTRLWFFAGLAVAILAGLGANQLASSQLQQALWKRKSRVLKSVGLYLAGGLAALLGYWLAFRSWHWLLALQLVTFTAGAGLLMTWAGGKIKGDALRAMLVPLLLCDLLPVCVSYIDRVEPRGAFLKTTPEFDFVSSQPGLFRVYSPLGTLPFALAAERRVELLEGALAFQIDHAVKAIRLATGCTKPGYATSVPICLDDIDAPSATPDAQRLGELNVRFVVTPQRLSDRYFRLAFRGEDSVYENLLWQPRVRLSPEGSVTIVDRQPGAYSLSTRSSRPAMLIVGETWLPGWQATVDGRPLSVERVNEVLIGVNVPAGDHQVRLAYNPLGWRIGWPITALSTAGLALWVLVTVGRRRVGRVSTSPQAEP